MKYGFVKGIGIGVHFGTYIEFGIKVYIIKVSDSVSKKNGTLCLILWSISASASFNLNIPFWDKP